MLPSDIPLFALRHFNHESKLSKAQRRYKLGSVSARYENRKTHMTTYYSQHPSLHLKGNWLIEAGFGTRTFVTMKVTEGSLVLIADNSEEQQLCENLFR
ncbi:TPA: type I toxin-antitoxin system SymE family toxin [Klebsiella aerogenes]|nr:type I toxin-antitoxin system SymE family toxin [Klebsiella aerogenes]